MFQLCPLGVNLCPFYRVTPIRALEAAGFLDRAISEKGSRYQRTGAGELHRKAILFQFGSEYAPAFIKAIKRAREARRALA